MTAILDTPANQNFLNPHNFKFVLHRAPNLDFFIQKVNIPGIRLPVNTIPTQFIGIQNPGTHMTADNLSIEFKIDEGFGSYAEIFNWIVALGFPENYEEYKSIATNTIASGEGIKSDISLFVLDGLKNPIFEFKFFDCFPYFLSDIEFDTTNPDVPYVTAEAQFTYTIFEFNAVNSA